MRELAHYHLHCVPCLQLCHGGDLHLHLLCAAVLEASLGSEQKGHKYLQSVSAFNQTSSDIGPIVTSNAEKCIM